MLAREIMTQNVITIGPEQSVEEAISLLAENKISGLPVVDENKKVLGIVSEADLLVRNKELHFPTYLQLLSGIIYLGSLKKFEEEIKKSVAVKVQEIMTKKVITAHPETTLEHLATLMIEKGVNRLPIVENEQIVGIVSRADIIRAQQNQKK